ncbi:MAG: ParA family protein [Alphaproteobacteria bacterium]|nr:ParA family protein [Alphaproteobacteria bacterium]
MKKLNANTVGHIVVFGNEKGGCGKSTAAMHATVALMRLGYKVGTIDLDARQGTFTRYLANRFQTVMREHKNIPTPVHMPIRRSEAATLKEKMDEESAFFFMALEEQTRDNDFVVIDTPGADSHLNRLAHRFADTLVTPVNDSMVDLDLIADIDPATMDVRGPSTYAKAVMAVREARKKELGLGLRWVVMRNRINPTNLKSKRDIEAMLQDLSTRFGFTYIPGFSERIIFRDMFLKGLTLLDLEGAETGKGLSASQLAARQEVRYLTHAIVPEEMRIALMRRKKASNAA